MFRYVAVIWNERSEADSVTAASLLKGIIDTSRDLRVSFECRGMKVLCTTQERTAAGRCHLSGESGIVLGTLFRAPNLREDACSTKLAALQQRDTRLVLDSGGQELIDRYWGRYVAFINDSQRGTKLIIRDPMGGLPCFVCKLRGVTVAFSCLQDCLDTGMLHFSLNWRHVAARVALGSWTINETGLEECLEVPSGHCLRISGDKTAKTNLWAPLVVAAHGPLDDLEVAASALRTVAQSCANSWASCYDNLLVDISGGLDSAIVAACLARTPSKPKVTAAKFNAETAPGETRRARLVAARMSYELVEIELQRHPIAIERLLAADPSVNLELDVGVCEALDAKRSLAHERGAIAVFDGSPGDVLFGASTKEFGAVDYVHRHGLDKRALKIALDVALMTDRSWWSVLAESLRRPEQMAIQDLATATMGYRHLPGDRARQLVEQNPELYSPETPVAHKTPGISEFLTIFTGGAQYYNPFGSALNTNVDPEPVSILRSQPLVELCLRIPPHIKNAGGRDRWVARQAFMNEIPKEITSTLWKDPAPNGTQARLLQSMASIRDYLNDGMLVKERLLDPHKLKDALAVGPVRRAWFPSELHDHFIAELWLRRMTKALEDSRCTPVWPAIVHA